MIPTSPSLMGYNLKSLRLSEGPETPPSTPVAPERIVVVVRVRPFTEDEREQAKLGMCTHTDGNRIDVSTAPAGEVSKRHTFTFDAVFPPDTTQMQLYNKVARHIVTQALLGFNGCIFAYGQTSSGKTHTMLGEASDEDLWGITPNSVNQIFDHIEVCAEEEDDSDYSVAVSFLEVYNEQVRDLLTDNKSNLPVRETPHHNFVVPGLSIIPVDTRKAVLSLIRQGVRRRETASTMGNDASSRSHAVLQIRIRNRINGDVDRMVTSKLNLVDLGGSERYQTRQDDVTNKESSMINQSLSSLASVITALGQRSSNKGIHVPYRDSKVTRLLKDSLGGNSKTLMIACLHPGYINAAETMTTLRYASRVKLIKNKPRVNEEPVDVVLRSLSDEVLRLEALLHQSAVTSQAMLSVVGEVAKNSQEMALEARGHDRMRYVLEQAEDGAAAVKQRAASPVSPNTTDGDEVSDSGGVGADAPTELEQMWNGVVRMALEAETMLSNARKFDDLRPRRTLPMVTFPPELEAGLAEELMTLFRGDVDLLRRQHQLVTDHSFTKDPLVAILHQRCQRLNQVLPDLVQRQRVRTSKADRLINKQQRAIKKLTIANEKALKWGTTQREKEEQWNKREAQLQQQIVAAAARARQLEEEVQGAKRAEGDMHRVRAEARQLEFQKQMEMKESIEAERAESLRVRLSLEDQLSTLQQAHATLQTQLDHQREENAQKARDMERLTQINADADQQLERVQNTLGTARSHGRRLSVGLQHQLAQFEKVKYWIDAKAESVLLTGTLRKRTHGALKRWQKRSVTLTSQRLCWSACKRSSKSAKTALGCLRLHDVAGGVTRTDMSDSFSLYCRTGSGATFHFQCPSKAECDKWTAAIDEQLSKRREVQERQKLGRIEELDELLEDEEDYSQVLAQVAADSTEAEAQATQLQASMNQPHSTDPNGSQATPASTASTTTFTNVAEQHTEPTDQATPASGVTNTAATIK